MAEKDRTEQKVKYSFGASKKINITKQELTLTVGENCNLACDYCYLHGKNTGRRMNFEIGRKAIDYFLNNTDFFTAPCLILDFVGGEPLMEIELIDKITDYFKLKAYQEKHRWFDNYKLSFSTNGTLYHTEKVQKYVGKNKNSLFPSISLDGVEEKHDRARKYTNGKGSYRDVLEGAKLMLKQIPHSTIKSTFGRGDIKYFKDSIIHFLEIGFPLDSIYANVVYEDVWDEGDDILFEQQLIELADYLIDNEICNSSNFGNIFSEAIGKPYTDEHLGKHWCNTGQAIIVGVDGSFYPCIRFLEIAFHEGKRARRIGDVYKGIDFDKLRPFRVLTLTNCSPKKCLQCDVATGCNMCSGQALDEASNVTIFYRPTHICKMHKARVRANEYFWKKLRKREKSNDNKDSYARELRIPNKKILNILLSSDSPAICNYDPNINKDKNNPKLLNLQILDKFLLLAKTKKYYVNFICPNHEIGDSYKALISEHKFQVTRPYKKENSKSTLEDRETFVFDMNQPIEPEFSCINVILHMRKNDLKSLENYSTKLFSNGVIRINLVIDDLSQWSDEDMRLYQEVLTGISQVIIDLLGKGLQRNFNVLTDRIVLDKMNNCNAGLEHITLGPDGKLYLCPAFYYKNQPIVQRKFQIPKELKQLLMLDNAPICSRCDAYQCRRCFFFNFLNTEELNVPGQKQCTISHIEREVSRKLQERLVGKKMIPYPNRNFIAELTYMDPFEIARVW